MRFNKFTYPIILSVLALAAACLQSCADKSLEAPDLPDYTVTGEPVTLSVSLTLPEMDVKTRANLDEAQLNQVNNVWLRTYSAVTKKATSEWVKATPGSTDTEVARAIIIESQSGSSYIVAVANVDNMGVTREDLTPTPLSDLLDKADTWDQFLKIAVVAPSTPEYVRAPRTPLTMVGCFADLVVNGTHPEPTKLGEWQDKDFQPYFIPAKNGTVDLKNIGAIHLRRLVSHLNFNVIPGDDVNVTVNSYQVMNAPVYSWLYERPAATDGLGANFGDVATAEADAENYYVDVPQYGSQNITINADGSSSFDFWQAENKHTGTADSYNARDQYTGNPKLFTSLTGNTWTANNEASYILVSCSVEYKTQQRVDDEGAIVNTGGTLVTRTGEATYIIHLGYIGNDPTDFNCYRNVDYTYNLTVNGVNDIRVDAYANPEQYHGEEGMVVDLDNSTIDIDAHYAAFNISLSQAELSDPNFGFIIITYENGNQFTISDANDQQQVGLTKEIYSSEDGTYSGVIGPKYYNWIELRPTTGANVLAEYKPRYGDNADGSTFLLSDLKGGWNAMSTAMRSTSGYYTVFVNEYTYEPMYTGGTGAYAYEEWDGTGRPAWMGYVNQNPRRFYIRTTQQVSPDGKSIYSRSKYGVSQQSLMSYYSLQVTTAGYDDVPPGTAIGVERVNENEGMNLRHNFAGGTSTANGRWNTAQYLNGSATATTNLSINNANANQRPRWDGYIDYDSPMEVGEVSGVRAQNGPIIPARTIANGNPFKIPKVVTTTLGGTYTFNDPQPNNTYRIEAINACMSRNRDNNGNGRIEPDELRWYVPAMDQYLAMMLGEGSLPDPLMDYLSVSQLPKVTNNQWNANGTLNNTYCSRYMCVSSNSGNSVMWLMEGTSTSNYSEMQSWVSGTSIRPWQIRCIRNLGADLTSVTEEDKVSKPYIHDEANHIFKMTYYDLESIRPTPYNGNGTGLNQMPIHTIVSHYNSVYYGFEYATTDITIASANASTNMAAYINTNPCGSAGLTGTDWRVPNQEELTIMRNAGLFEAHNVAGSLNTTWLSCTVNYFNSTTGVGSAADTSGKLYLVVTPTQGTQLTQDNLNSALRTTATQTQSKLSDGFFIRCVRDVNN